MLLHFVNEPTIGPNDRRLIRSHVMRGKNAGRPRPARRPLKHQNFTPRSSRVKEDAETEALQAIDLKHTLRLDRLFWNELTIASFPAQVSPQTRRFVYQRLRLISKALYPPSFCTEVDLKNYAWFQYILEDKAYFHTLLAISSSFPTHFGSTQRTISGPTLSHISRAYRLTNARLSSAEACSDKAIAVVTMLAVFQRLHHQHDTGLVHFAGLKRMIGLRGGLRGLMGQNRGVGQKPWRLALEFALQDGSVPAFGIDEVPDVQVDVGLGDEMDGEVVDGLETELQGHGKAIRRLVRRLNAVSNTGSSKLDPEDYSDIVSHHLHRLLAYAPLLSSDRLTNWLDNLVHLVLVAIMTTLMPEYGHNQARYDLLASLLRIAICRLAMDEADGNAEVLLWAIFVGYVTVLARKEDEVWLARLARDICVRLNVKEWKYVREVLCEYGWICVMYDEPGKKLWGQISSATNK